MGMNVLFGRIYLPRLVSCCEQNMNDADQVEGIDT